MLKDRGHKGSWKGSGSSNPRTKKKSYGNIHSINDRGIHEIQGRPPLSNDILCTIRACSNLILI